MKSVSDELIEKVADQVFALQERLFTASGGVGPQIFGLTLKADGIAKVTGVTPPEDLHAALPGLLTRMQRQFDMVCTVFEAWASKNLGMRPEGDPERSEAVHIMLYSDGRTHVLLCPIHRNPDRLERGLLEEPEQILGLLTPDGTHMSEARLQRASRDVRELLTERPEMWQLRLRSLITEFLNANRVREIFALIEDPELPTESLNAAHEYFQHLYTCLTRPAGPDRSPAQFWLTGALLVLDARAHSQGLASIDVAALTRRFVEEVRARQADAVSQGALLEFTYPEDPLVVFEPTPGTLLHSASLEYLTAREGRRVSGKATAMVRKRTAVLLPNMLQNAHDLLPITVPAVLTPTLPDNLIEDEWSWRQTPSMPAPIQLQMDAWDSVVAGAAAATGAAFGITVTSPGVARIHHCIKRMLDLQRSTHLGLVIAHSLDDEPPSDLRAELSVVTLAEPRRLTTASVVLWSKSTGSLRGVATPYCLAQESREEFLGHLEAVLRNVGVEEVAIYPETLRVQARPRDPERGTSMIPDFHGGWIHPDDLIAPGSREIVRQLHWKVARTGLEEDPRVQALPVPHMRLRLGLTDTAQQHYMPGFYRDLKHYGAMIELDSDALWRALTERYPQIPTVESAAATSVKPHLADEYALRMHWTRSPTLLVRDTLIQRMKLTSLKLSIPAAMLRPPYPLCYLHFETPLEHVAWGIDAEASASEPSVVYLEGAYVHSTPHGAGRRLSLLLMARAPGSWETVVSQQFVLDVVDEETPVFDLCQAYARSVGMSEAELAESETALEEIFKALVYSTTTDARLQDRPVRTQAMRELRGKSGERAQKITRKARGLFDHILVGPEHALPPLVGPGLSGRTMPVHPRRGFYNKYWTGTGRAVLVVRYIEPVVVNKHLLEPGAAPPAPRNYTLQ